MVIVLEQDLECVVLVLVPVLWLDLFDKRGENGRVVLLSAMGRDVLPFSARKEFDVEGVICDIQPGSQADFLIAASIDEVVKVDKSAKHVHCRGDVGVHSWVPG